MLYVKSVLLFLFVTILLHRIKLLLPHYQNVLKATDCLLITENNFMPILSGFSLLRGWDGGSLPHQPNICSFPPYLEKFPPRRLPPPTHPPPKVNSPPLNKNVNHVNFDFN